MKSYSRSSRRLLIVPSNRTVNMKSACDVLRMRITRMASVAADTPGSEDFAKKLTLSNDVKDDFVTEHLYYTDTELCESKGKVIGVRLIEFQGESRNAIILDQTVMHPQGGKKKLFWHNLLSTFRCA